MSITLPSRLKKEPLIDALFEMRFIDGNNISNIVPGLIYGRLEGEKTISDLPAKEIPKQIRDADVNLRFAPLVRLFWNGFIIGIGDRTLSVSCVYPYPGWAKFREAIMEVVGHVASFPSGNAGLGGGVERYSLKYTDLVEAEELEEQIGKLNLSLRLAGEELKDQNFRIRMDVVEGNVIHILSITPGAKADLKGVGSRVGVVVDVDSIDACHGQSFDDWFESLPDRLDGLHLNNKGMFFKSLREEAVIALEPEYDN